MKIYLQRGSDKSATIPQTTIFLSLKGIQTKWLFRTIQVDLSLSHPFFIGHCHIRSSIGRLRLQHCSASLTSSSKFTSVVF